jgi:hypothetical protein
VSVSECAAPACSHACRRMYAQDKACSVRIQVSVAHQVAACRLDAQMMSTQGSQAGSLSALTPQDRVAFFISLFANNTEGTSRGCGTATAVPAAIGAGLGEAEQRQLAGALMLFCFCAMHMRSSRSDHTCANTVSSK